jgi:hypothetical protein
MPVQRLPRYEILLTVRRSSSFFLCKYIYHYITIYVEMLICINNFYSPLCNLQHVTAQHNVSRS